VNKAGNSRPEMRPETQAAAAGNRHVPGRLAAGAAVAAFLIAGIGITVELLPEDDASLVDASVLLSLWWGVGGAAVAALAVPTWLGRQWPRRLLAVCCLAGSAGAIYWLSYEQTESAGLLAGVSVAVLLAAAFLAAAVGERTP